MANMIRFYRDVLGFEVKEGEDTSNVYLIKDDTLFLLYGRKDFEKMTSRKYEYIKGLNGHTEIGLLSLGVISIGNLTLGLMKTFQLG